MKKITKITISLLLILLVFLPVFFLLIYPNYNKLVLIFSDLDPYRNSKDISINLLTKLAPSKDTFDTKVLGATSIEESLNNADAILRDEILERLHTQLSISSINIKGYLAQGTSSHTMEEGFWHFPSSKYPGDKGNVVIIGHRFQYIPPATNTFYNLDKVRIGDSINIEHDDGEYTYIVVDTKVIDPNDLSVLKDTSDYRLTLITCTPLWTSEKRLVITAKLDKLFKKV